MELDLSQILKASGVFIYPLLACSVLVFAVTIERVIALCFVKVFPQSLFEAIVRGEWSGNEVDPKSTGGRILQFYCEGGTDPDGLKAYARLEVSRLERGLFLLGHRGRGCATTWTSWYRYWTSPGFHRIRRRRRRHRHRRLRARYIFSP